MQPLVSILIPAYNAERWIADTIRSAVAQTWPRKEIIIVDDGSTDRTLAVARQFESESLRVFSQQNQGAAAARNKAFSLSQGDYIQWLDADDLLAPDKIARQMAVLEPERNRRILLSSSWGEFMFRPRRARFVPTALWSDLSPAEFLLNKLGRKVYMQTGVWLASRELSEAAGPWNTSMLSDDDGEYFCRVLMASEGIRFVPEAKVYYRFVGTGRLSYIGQSNRKLDAFWGSMKLHIGYLRSLEESERSRAACLQYLRNYLIVFFPGRPDIVEQMHETAKSLGGRLEDPRLRWKYAWIEKLAGWECAKRAQLLLPKLKWSLIRRADELAFHLEGGRLGRVNPEVRTATTGEARRELAGPA